MKNSSSTLYLRKMCRGMGKIYAQLDIPTDLTDCDFCARSTLADGREMPCKLLPYGDKAKVLVLAVLDVVQTVVIRATDANGHVREELRRAVRPQVAKLSSQVHTFLSDGEMEGIRNFDALAGFNEFWVNITRVVREPWIGTDIVQGTAACTGLRSVLESGELEVLVLDRAGNEAMARPSIILRDGLADMPDAPECAQRDVQYTVVIPESLQEFIIWVRPKQDSAAAPQGFLAVEAHGIAWWRDMAKVWMQPAQADRAYTDKFDLNWKVSRAELDLQRHARFEVEPKFSVIVPLYRTPRAYLDEMILSVINQSYGNLELVLVNASPEDTELAQAVEAWREKDSRIEVVYLAENLGITLNTNEGIKAATGDFLCFLDHDDFLSLDALFCYAKALNEYPTTDLLYSDEDHYEDGLHTCPYFKPDWNPDLLMGMNYVCHFLCVRKSIVDSMELPTSEFDGAQDHHMTFRVAEKARNIYHCRKVLYHWRVHPGSTASGVGEKPYAVEAGRLAVQAHLDRCGQAARAVHSTRMPNRYEVEYDLDAEPLVSILIPNKDAVPVLGKCLVSIRQKTDYQNYEIIIIENNSTDDETFSYYERVEAEDPHVRVVRYRGGFNFARINNYGASFARGAYLLMLNNDTEVVTPHWLRRMVALCSRETTGIVGAKLLYPDNTIQHVGVVNLAEGPDHVNRFSSNNNPTEMLHMLQDVSAVTGACLMVKRTVFDEVGGLDEAFEVDYNDIDFCWKVGTAGYRLVCDPSVVLYHYESISRGFHTSKESALRFEREKGMLRKKWDERFAYTDPMGNPNFNQRSLYCQLK